MYLRDAPHQPLHLSSSPLSSATTFLLGLGILFDLGVVIAYWPIFVAAGIACGALLAARAAVRRHRRRQRAHAAIAVRRSVVHLQDAALRYGLRGQHRPDGHRSA